MYINIEKTTKLIQEKECDAVILFNESNMHYLCSFSPSEGVIIITKNGNSYHIASSFVMSEDRVFELRQAPAKIAEKCHEAELSDATVQ